MARKPPTLTVIGAEPGPDPWHRHLAWASRHEVVALHSQRLCDRRYRRSSDVAANLRGRRQSRDDGQRQRVASELKTTFASHYTQVVSLQETLQLS
jgi:hypothetical protein